MIEEKIKELETNLGETIRKYQGKQVEMQEIANEVLRIQGAIRELKICSPKKKWNQNRKKEMNTTKIHNQNDHDLLIEIKVELKNLVGEFKDFRESQIREVAKLDTEKVNRIEFQELQNKVNKDMETRVKVLENWKIWVLGYSAGIALLISFLISEYLHK
jgi:hypothetical protein